MHKIAVRETIFLISNMLEHRKCTGRKLFSEKLVLRIILYPVAEHQNAAGRLQIYIYTAKETENKLNSN